MQLSRRQILARFTDEMNSLIKKYEKSQTKEIWLSNKGVVNLLYDYISQYHEIKSNNESTLDKVNEIEKRLIEDKLSLDGFKKQDNTKEDDSSENAYKIDAFHKALAYEIERNVYGRDTGKCYEAIRNALHLYDALKGQAIGNECSPFQDICKGVQAEENVYEQLKSYLKNDCIVINGYRHKCELGNKQTSENDILVVCRKGIFTIEIKSASHEKAVIQSSGVLLYGDTVAEKNPVEQSIKHKVNLVSFLEGVCPEVKKYIFPVVYLENVEAIENNFSSVDVFNKIAILADSIMKKEDVLSEEQLVNINAFIEENALKDAEFKYEIAIGNPYQTVMEFRADIAHLVDYYIGNFLRKDNETRYRIKTISNIALLSVIEIVLSIGMFFCLKLISFHFENPGIFTIVVDGFLLVIFFYAIPAVLHYVLKFLLWMFGFNEELLWPLTIGYIIIGIIMCVVYQLLADAGVLLWIFQ